MTVGYFSLLVFNTLANKKDNAMLDRPPCRSCTPVSKFLLYQTFGMVHELTGFYRLVELNQTKPIHMYLVRVMSV